MADGIGRIPLALEMDDFLRAIPSSEKEANSRRVAIASVRYRPTSSAPGAHRTDSKNESASEPAPNLIDCNQPITRHVFDQLVFQGVVRRLGIGGDAAAERTLNIINVSSAPQAGGPRVEDPVSKFRN